MEGVLRELVRQLVSVVDLKVLAAFRSGVGTEEALVAQRRINRRIVDAFVPLLAASMEAGVVRSDIDPEAVVEFIDLVIDGLNRRRALDGFVSSDDRLTEVITAAVVPLIAASMEAGGVSEDIAPGAVGGFIDLVIDGLNRRRALDGFVSSDDRLTEVITAAVERFLLVSQEDPR